MTTTFEEPPSLPSSPTLQPFYPNSNSNNTTTTTTKSKSTTSPNGKRVHSSPQLTLGEVQAGELSFHSNNNNLGSKKVYKGLASGGQVVLENELNNSSTFTTTLSLPSSSLTSSQMLPSTSRTTIPSIAIGVGVGRSEAVVGGLPQLALSAALNQMAEAQTRRLYEMPIEFSSALSRLCSQHRSSQYNTMKRATTESIAVPAPLTFLSNHPILPTLPVPATRPYMATRSHSTPNPCTLASSHSPVEYQYPQQQTEPESIPLTSNLSNTSASTSTSSNVSPLLPSSNQTLGITGSTSTSTNTTRQCSPSESTPSTPPPGSMTTSHDLTQGSTLILGREGDGEVASLTNTSSTPGAISTTSSSSSTSTTTTTNSTSLTPTINNFSLTSSSSTTNEQQDHSNKLASSMVGAREKVPIPAGLRIHLLPGMKIMNGVPVKTSVSHPMNITAIIPPEFIPLLSSHILRSPSIISTSPTTPTLRLGNDQPFILNSPSLSFDLWDIASQPTSFTPLIESLAAATSDVLSSSSKNTITSSIPPFGTSVASFNSSTPPLRQIGNFYLSSCPGKKVRLDGVIQGKGGRGAICRSVEMDLERAKAVGVKVVVCCLDDAELEYLGSPWSEYLTAANSLSLQVIRIPMVEGFAPLSPSSLDLQLSTLIRHHTLKGESILAHCRGGIGRAGLVACVWMIKLGLIRVERIEEEERREGGMEEEMRVVERVIEVIRRRRSVKSIETPQQVHFLLDYVTYLKQKSQVVQAFEL